MPKDMDSVGDVLNLSVIYENDEEIRDDERVYHFYKYGESIEDTAMKVKVQLAEYRRILDCLCQHSAEHGSMRNKLSKIAKRKTSLRSKNNCHVCNIAINLENSSDFVTCGSCNKSPVCRNLNCAIWSDKSKVWDCKLCRSFLNGSSSACDWLISQLNERLLQGKSADNHNKIVWNQANSNDNAPLLIPLEQREKVREFVEELVSTLVGGSIDNAPVGQLYENVEYLSLFSSYHSRLSKKLHNLELSIRRMLFGLPTGENETDSIDESHTNLRLLVERIIEEVFKIPELFDHSGVPSQPQRINLPQFDPKKYEELLATAVLNKLVESYSYERRFENSSGVHSASDIDNVHTSVEKAQLETISTSSSNEPRSDSSNSISLNEQPMSLTTASHYIGKLSRENSNASPIDSPSRSRSVGSDEEAYLSDYIQKHKVPLPGIETIDSDSFDEDLQSINSNDTEGNWQENWLFRKRKLKNETASAIGMLVPSPMEDVKALIGDKTTDEVSDLSEAGSDLDDDEMEPVNGRKSADLPHALVESKTIIGGKNDFGSFNEVKTIDELLQPDSLVSMQSIDNQSPVIMEAKNDLILMSECNRKPVVLHATEKKIHSSSSSNNNSASTNDIMVNENASIQNGSIQSATNQSTESTFKDVPVAKGSVFHIENGEPPIPTPRKKSKSLELVKQAAAVEVPTHPTIHESLPINIAVVSQIDELLTKSVDDQLIDSSINDIYESIEGDHTLDYQSLVTDDDQNNEIGVMSTSHPLILGASNPFVEDWLNETTQELSQSQLEKQQFDSLSFIEPISGPSSHISTENYICKVVPTEFDLSVDSVLQYKSDITLDVIVNDELDDKSVSQGIYISSKPALTAVELASPEASNVPEVEEELEKKEPTASIPTLIISKSCGDTPSPTTETSDDNVSLKPKKILKAQDSLELPIDDRVNFEPTKRVDSLELEDVDRNIGAKFGALENIVNSVAECVKSSPDANVNVNVTTDYSEDDFVIVTEEEVNSLKIEIEESLSKPQDQLLSFDSLTNTKSEESLHLDCETTSDEKHEPDVSFNQSVQTQNDIQETSAKISANYSTDLESSPQPELKPTVINAPKTCDSPAKIRDSLPAIQEHEVTKTATTNTYSTSDLFTNQPNFLDSATNITQPNDQGPLPGSIAEREHLKWMNAQDIPNNPYSAEALQRRLSQKSPTKVIDINLALAAKSIDDPSITPAVENGKPMQIVLGAGEPDQLRYGRDYYINDSKTSCGTRKKTSSVQRYSSTDEDNISSKVTTPDCDVFTAKIVLITDDPGHTSDDSTKLKVSLSDRASDNSSLSLQSDSLLSDDSETRVYDLRKNETVYLRSDIIRTSRIPVGATVTPPSTPIDGELTQKNLDQFFAIKQLNQLKKSEEEQETSSQIKTQVFHTGVSKPLSPETLKFFAPKPKPVFTSKIKMEEIVSVKPLILEREEKVTPQNGTIIEKGVIEEDVISALPSVKALAKNFIEPSTETTKQPIQRPKTFTWQVSNENGNSTNGFSKEPSPDSFIPMYEPRYHPVAPGHSITARSLSTKFREELRHSISDDASNSTDNIEIVEREHSSDRPSSPVLLKGIFKEKMSFFQNLETK